MKLRIYGEPQKIDRELVRQAAKFYVNHLFDDEPDINLCLYFNKDNYLKALGNHAMCFDKDCDDYDIFLNSKAGKRQSLINLAHEVVHLKQYVKKELKFDLDRYDHNQKFKHIIWQGKPYKTKKDILVYETPWEIMALGMEVGLYYRFVIDNDIKIWDKNDKKI